MSEMLLGAVISYFFLKYLSLLTYCRDFLKVAYLLLFSDLEEFNKIFVCTLFIFLNIYIFHAAPVRSIIQGQLKMARFYFPFDSHETPQACFQLITLSLAYTPK